MVFGEKDIFPEFKEAFGGLLDYCKGRKIAVAGHMRPDGDCVSSTIALVWALRECGASEVVALNRDSVPFLYRNIAAGTEFIKTDSFDFDGFETITVDCADPKRVSDTFSERVPCPLASIDHHVSNNAFAKTNIICPDSAATAELLAGMFFDAGLRPPKEVCNALFTGIVTDTRSFTTNSTRAETLAVAAKLAAAGASPSYVAEQLYQRERPEKLGLLAAYLKSLRFGYGGRLCYGILRKADFDSTGALKEDTDGLVDYARSINGVRLAAVLEEISDGVKGSIRTKSPDMRADLLAAKFGGGGHKSAAGFSLRDGTSLDEFTGVFEKAAGELLDNADI